MEEINKLKTNYEVMSKQLEYLSEGSVRIEKKLDDYIVEDKLWKKEFCDQIERRYAAKYIEKIVIGLSGVMLYWVINQILSSIS